MPTYQIECLGENVPTVAIYDIPPYAHARSEYAEELHGTLMLKEKQLDASTGIYKQYHCAGGIVVTLARYFKQPSVVVELRGTHEVLQRYFVLTKRAYVMALMRFHATVQQGTGFYSYHVRVDNEADLAAVLEWLVPVRKMVTPPSVGHPLKHQPNAITAAQVYVPKRG